jgi:hypothetical protein
MDSKEPNARPLRNERADDFVSTYANNAAFEPSVWDMKIIFGELDQGAGTIQQHTAIAMPWIMAKLMVHHLSMQIATHEIVHGKIRIPPDVLPPEVTPPPASFKDDPKFQKVYEALKTLHEEFRKNA